MNGQHRAIRALITTMAPKRAVDYIQSFDLPPEEENTLIACDVRRMSYVQAAELYHMTPEVIKRRKMSAYAHIADGINHRPAHI